MRIGYARVSTHDQNLDLQKDALKKAGCDKVIVDVASGKKEKRSGLDRARDQLRKGDVLVVWRLDRLGRSLKHLIELMNEMEGAGIGFCSIQESINTTTPGGKLVFHIFGALAEFEHCLIRERTIAGLAAARARGRKGGRKPALSPADVRKAAAMLADPDITKAEIAKHFSVSRVTLNAALKRAGIVDPQAAAKRATA